MNHFVKLFLPCILLLLFLFAVSCDDEDGVQECDTYFLKESRLGDDVTTIFYNDDALIDKVASGTSANSITYDFFYNSNSQLAEVTATNGFRGEYHYNDEGKLGSCITYYENAPDQRNEFKFFYDSEGRLNMRELYIGLEAPYAYYTVEYPDSKTVKMRYFIQVGEEEYEPADLFIYTIDDKHLPYPDEYYILAISLGEKLTLHNPLSLVSTGIVNSTETFSYEYNEGGYPEKQNQRTFTYSCEPVKEQ